MGKTKRAAMGEFVLVEDGVERRIKVGEDIELDQEQLERYAAAHVIHLDDAADAEARAEFQRRREVAAAKARARGAAVSEKRAFASPEKSAAKRK